MRYQNATTGLFPAESFEVNVASLRQVEVENESSWNDLVYIASKC